MTEHQNVREFKMFESLHPTHSEAWNWLISAEIDRFLTAFQQIAIDVAPPDANEPIVVGVHAPYMMQRVALIDRPKEFAHLKKRHQDRLLRVKAAREQAPEPIKQFLHSHLYDEAGQERLLAAGRGVDCSSFVQQALNCLLQAAHAVVGQGNNQGGIRFLRSFRAYNELTIGPGKGESLFTAVGTPAEA